MSDDEILNAAQARLDARREADAAKRLERVSRTYGGSFVRIGDVLREMGFLER